MKQHSAIVIGFWSAALAFVFSNMNMFTLGGVIGGMFPPPWDVALPVSPSILLAPTFAVLMVAVYQAAPEDKKVWAHADLAIALLYAALATIVYVTWLFVVEPQVLRGNEASVSMFAFAPGSFIQMVDGLAYTYSCLAAFFTAPIFANRGFERWIRWTAIANGIAAIPFFLSYVFYSLLLELWWSITIPAYALLPAILLPAGKTVRPLGSH
jgi:hypothetical protein